MRPEDFAFFRGSRAGARLHCCEQGEQIIALSINREISRSKMRTHNNLVTYLGSTVLERHLGFGTVLAARSPILEEQSVVRNGSCFELVDCVPTVSVTPEDRTRSEAGAV